MRKYSDYDECISSIMKAIKFLADSNNLPIQAIIKDFIDIMEDE